MVVVDAKKSHVVLLASPGIGHVTPMLELAKRLVVHHSCHVTFLRITTQASAALLHHLPPGLTVIDLPPADVPAVTSEKNPYFHNLCITIRESLLSLKPTLLDMEMPNALITDLFCTQAMETCRDLSIPFYVFSTVSALYLAFAFLCLNLNLSSNADKLGQFLHLPGCKSLKKEDLPFAEFSEIDEWFTYHLRRVTMADGILMNTWEDLEPEPVRAIREHPFYKQIPMVYPVGPLVKQPEPDTGKEEKCLVGWLDKQAPHSVLFVALGSAGNLCAEQLTELAWGLELSQQRFLWVARPPTDASGIKSYLKVANENDPELYLPEGFLERTKELGMVVPSWASQVLVLQHESTGAFLSHCGWNSVLESLSHGVPLMAWPLCADQMISATLLAEDLGVAIKPMVEVGRKVIGRKEIERVVREVMVGEEGKRLRDRARELKQSVLKTVHCGGKSHEALAHVVNQW